MVTTYVIATISSVLIALILVGVYLWKEGKAEKKNDVSLVLGGLKNTDRSMKDAIKYLRIVNEGNSVGDE